MVGSLRLLLKLLDSGQFHDNYLRSHLTIFFLDLLHPKRQSTERETPPLFKSTCQNSDDTPGRKAGQ